MNGDPTNLNFLRVSVLNERLIPTFESFFWGFENSVFQTNFFDSSTVTQVTIIKGILVPL